MQCRGLQNYPATSLPCTRFNGGDKFGKLSLINFRNIGTPSLVNDMQPKTVRLNVDRNFHSFRSLTDSSRFAVPVQSQLRARFPNPVKPIYISTHENLETSIRFSSPYFGALPKRPFSHVPSVKNAGDKFVTGDGATENSSLIKTSNKHKKQKKSSAAYRRSFNSGVHAAVSNQPTKAGSSSSRRSALGNGEMMAQPEQLVDNGLKDVNLTQSISTSPVSNNNQGSKATEKQRKQSTKKITKQVTSTNASSRVVQKKNTKSSSLAKKPNITKNSQAPQASEVRSVSV